MTEKKEVLFCDLRYSSKSLFDMDKTQLMLEDDDWVVYHTFISEELSIYNKFYKKEIEVLSE